MLEVSPHLVQQVGSYPGLGSSLAGTETLVADAAPLRLRPDDLLPPAVEALGLVEVEVVLGQLVLQAQEGLQSLQLNPRSGYELVTVHHVYLVSGEH